MKYLVDTNVVSELRKGPRASQAVVRWFASIDPDAPFVSVLTFGEIRNGIERMRRRDAQASANLERWLEQLVTGYSDRIVSVDQAIAEEWGRMTTTKTLPVVDGLLAATAKVHGLTLATRNGRDVAGTGVPVTDPFDYSGPTPSSISEAKPSGGFAQPATRPGRIPSPRRAGAGRKAKSAQGRSPGRAGLTPLLHPPRPA